MLGGADSMPRDEGEAVVRVAIAALDKAMAIEDAWRKLFQLKHGADAAETSPHGRIGFRPVAQRSGAS
jgi:hypothetical protein